MELVDNEDVEAMVALCCWDRSCQTDSIQLFFELADVDLEEDSTQLGEKREVQDPCTMVEDYSDPDLDKVPDGINHEGATDDRNVNVSLVGNPSRGIMIRNGLGAHILIIDLNAAHTSKFPEYPAILHAHWLVIVSKPTLYIGECWRSAEGFYWRVRVAFIQKLKMWEIQKFVGLYTCISTRMAQDHRKLDSKTIYTCIMPMVKDMPTIPILVLIAEMKE
ncbi:hypothetical protein GOBAR_DD32506 [Gossypium barbadense]|nr:hypothetical protein GOBAR_DD32506 [Gossypium barbadense]